jgi:hypothetical protein
MEEERGFLISGSWEKRMLQRGKHKWVRDQQWHMSFRLGVVGNFAMQPIKEPVASRTT